MPDRVQCSCGACEYRRGKWWQVAWIGESDPVVACPDCGDRLYADGTRVSMEQMDADHAAMQWLRETGMQQARSIRVRGAGFISDGGVADCSAALSRHSGGTIERRDTTIEAAIAAVLALQPEPA